MPADSINRKSLTFITSTDGYEIFIAERYILKHELFLEAQKY